MQNDTKRSMRTRRHGPATGPFSVRSKGSDRELSRPVGVRFTMPKGATTLYSARARRGIDRQCNRNRELLPTCRAFFRLMKERAV